MGLLALDPWTRDILWQVCHMGPYASSVTLAIDLADLGKIGDDLNAVPLLEMALAELNALGLVTYVEPHGFEHGKTPIARIRATQPGYDAMGFKAPMVKVIGAFRSRGSHAADHPGDGTDWRNQPPTAFGEEIERMTLREHMEKYWSHAHKHFASLREIELGDDPD